MAIAKHLSLMPALALWVACHGHPAGIEVVSAAEVGIVPQSAAIRGHDGGASALLFGHSVWLYGDTALTLDDATGETWHSNSFAYTDDLDASDGLSGFQDRLDAAHAPVPILANTDEEMAFNIAHYGDPCATSPCGARWALWPGAAVFDATRNRALLFYGLVYAEPGDFNFHGVGQSLAVWTDFTAAPQRPVVSPGTSHPTLLFAENDPGYGAAAAIDGDDLYTLACDADGLARPCTLARVPLASALDRSSFSFWDGRSWTQTIGDAKPIFDGGLGLSLFRLRGVWVVSYAAPLSSEIRARTASALTGEWSDETKLFSADRKGDSGWTYDAYAHPELMDANGHFLFFTFTRPTQEGWFASETALVRVEVR